MDLNLNEDEQVLQDSIAETLGSEVTTELIRKVEKGSGEEERQAMWRTLAQLGYLGLPVSEAAGGTGGSVIDLALLLEQAGRVAVPGPLVESAIAALILDEAGTRADALRAILAGDATACIGWAESEADRLEHLSFGDAKGSLRGTKISVPYGVDARYMIAFGRNAGGGAAVYFVELDQPGVKRSPRAVISEDPTVDIEISDYAADQALLTDDPERVGRWRDLLFTGYAAYATGLCDQMLETTLDYARNREQFGHPIGSYQAVQHRCVDMALVTHGSRYLVYQAAFLLGKGGSASFESAMAQHYTAQAIERSVRHAHQVHAAIGYSREIDLQIFTRRAKNLQVQLGGQAGRADEIAAAIGLQAGA